MGFLAGVSLLKFKDRLSNPAERGVPMDHIGNNEDSLRFSCYPSGQFNKMVGVSPKQLRNFITKVILLVCVCLRLPCGIPPSAGSRSGIPQGESAANSSLSCFSLYFSCLSYFRVFVIRFELFSVLSVPLW